MNYAQFAYSLRRKRYLCSQPQPLKGLLIMTPNMRKNRYAPDCFELKVLSDLAAGYSPAEIATRHRWRVQHVYQLLASARVTLSAPSTLMAVLIAYRMGYIEIPPLEHFVLTTTAPEAQQARGLPVSPLSPTPQPVTDSQVVRRLPAVHLALLARLADPAFVAKTNAARGLELDVKATTVKKRLTYLYKHLGVQSCAAAAMRAVELRPLVQAERTRRQPKGTPQQYDFARQGAAVAPVAQEAE
jgi:hypothetical protein